MRNTPIVAKNVNLDNPLNIVPDQIDSFVSSDTEPDAAEFLDTLEVFDNAYKNIKYQKIKDILIKDIKKDVCDLIQNEIRQKINLYSQDEHQTLVDKRIIANLEKEIHFLKTEIETKNEIIQNFIKNDPHRDENNNVPQDGQIRVFTHISNDSETNLINTVNRNIDEQLKLSGKTNTNNIFRTLLANLRHKKILLLKQTKRMTETKLMNNPMTRITKMKLKTNKMKETISLLAIRNMRNSWRFNGEWNR